MSMVASPSVPDEPVAAITRHRRASFSQEIELTDLRDVERDSKSGNEASIVSTPKTVDLVQALSVTKERVYLAALCWGFLVWGWNDGTLGPLLPTIQKHYNARNFFSRVFVTLNAVLEAV